MSNNKEKLVIKDYEVEKRSANIPKMPEPATPRSSNEKSSSERDPKEKNNLGIGFTCAKVRFYSCI